MTPPTSLKFLLQFILLLHLVTPNSKAQKSNRIDDYPTIKNALNKKVLTSNKSYYTIKKSTDSTVHLLWGNDTLKRTLNEDLDLWPAAERFSVKWFNKDYMIVEYWTGSEAWTDLVLPLNKKEKVQAFSNGICFDSVYNLLGIEQYKDTILLAINLKTKKKQYIIDKEHICDGASNSFCIDTIAIRNKILYVKWVVPNNYTDKKKTYKKMIRLHI